MWMQGGGWEEERGRRRCGFGIRRQSVASLMVGSIIDLDLKPMCLIKLIGFSF